MKNNKTAASGNKNTKADLKSFLSARNTKRGAVSIAITVLIVAALILLNVLTGSLTSQYSLYADLTSNSAYRLQDVTAQYAASVEKDVDFYVLATETDFEDYGDYYAQANMLIHQFCESSPHITLHYVDLTANPTFTAAYPDVKWEDPHLCLVVCGDSYRVIEAEDMFDYEQDSSGYYYVTDQHIEQAIAAAVLTVTAEHLPTVSVLTGQAEEDMTPFTTLLQNNAYNVVSVDLNAGTIAEDCEFLIIYSPAVDIDDDMLTYLKDWLYNGGEYGHNIIYMPCDKRNVSEFPNLNELIADYGMSVDYGYIYEYDLSYVAASLGTSLCSRYDYADDTFTKDLMYPSIPVYLYYTLPVNITDGTLAKPMLTSSDTAFYGPISDADADRISDEYQKYNGAAIGTKSNGSTDNEKSSHVVVIGSYDAFSKGFLEHKSYNNAAYFVNIFNVLSVNDNVGVVIEGKDLNANTLGANEGAAETIGVVVRFIIPGAVLIAGLIIWLIRRRR